MHKLLTDSLLYVVPDKFVASSAAFTEVHWSGQCCRISLQHGRHPTNASFTSSIRPEGSERTFAIHRLIISSAFFPGIVLLPQSHDLFWFDRTPQIRIQDFPISCVLSKRQGRSAIPCRWWPVKWYWKPRMCCWKEGSLSVKALTVLIHWTLVPHPLLWWARGRNWGRNTGAVLANLHSSRLNAIL